MATMHAAQFHGARDIRINTIAKPTPTSTQVLIDVEWCGICGTDLHEYTDGPIAIPTAENPHSFTGEAFPVTLGHEFCGRVTLAPQGSQLKVGQAVIVDPRYYCGNCLTCGKGFHNMCKTWGFVGLSGGGGGLSESVAVEARACYSLPEGADLRYAALVEPLAVARHALNSSGFAEWKDLSVLVLGGGPVGLAVAMDLRVHGARRIIVSEPSAVRRTHIAKYCDVALDPLETSVADECRRVTGGGGVDVVIDCAGAMPALRAGFDAVKHKGTYVNVAGWGTEVCIFQTCGNHRLRRTAHRTDDVLSIERGSISSYHVLR